MSLAGVTGTGTEFVVRDEWGRPLALEPDPIGGGGQGQVYRVRDSRLAVKLLTTVRWRRDVQEGLTQRLRAIGRLPLDDLPLARPVVMLAEPHVGFVMELVDGVVPIGQLCRIPQGELDDWYRETGGLSRRLRLTARLASVLSTLHGRGIVYGDPSPANVLVSARADRDEVWLIDPDNLAIETDAARTIAGTPGYAAPELATGGARLSTLSDAFAFAVLAFETLTAFHPFKGDQLYDSDETQLDVLQQESVRYRLAWVDHSEDPGNRLTYGMSRDAVYTPTLRQLFQDAFEDGLRSPSRRPGMSAWAEALVRAADATRSCARCGQDFYVDRAGCPWCGSPAVPVLVGRVFTHLRPVPFDDEPQQQPAEPAVALVPTRDVIVVESGRWISVPARIGHASGHADPAQKLVAATWDGEDRLTLRNASHRTFHLVSRDGRHRKRLEPQRETVAMVRPGWLLHLTDQLSAPHRVIAFDRLTWPR